MQTFRSVVEPEKLAPTSISYRHSVLSIGSCFAENIGGKLKEHGYSVLLNPFGIQFNPASIAQTLDFILSPKPFDERYFIEHNNLWHHDLFHGRFSSERLETIQAKTAKAVEQAHQVLMASDFLVLTFGTAWVYKRGGRVVANCHKLPAAHFQRHKLSVQEVVESYSRLIEELVSQRPGIKIIFTLSPIRHIKDGFSENQVSKAILKLAITELLALWPNHSFYFPAYEIMLDDLRDYRFYAQDLFHPSELAIQYIWEAFASACLEKSEAEYRKKVAALSVALKHKPMTTDANSLLEMKQKQEAMLNKLIQEYPLSEALKAFL